ncbi:MAG TPA: glycosyltransferase [archaeon]|nr:glycosyltransferase [archaeon]
MGLYIQLHSMHGLFRSKNLELGRNEDTGGQIVYVLELAKALGELSFVDKVVIVTRKITDPSYPGYSKPVEKISEKVSIARVSCGPEKYVKKTELWPHIDEFTENCRALIKKSRRKPDILHSHYADSGLVCSRLSEELGIPFVHTGHSLGIPKMQKLHVTKKNTDAMNAIYHFDTRLQVEQRVIDSADAITVSTNEEMRNQYGGYRVGAKKKKFKFIPPGIDLRKFYPPRKKPSPEDERQFLFFFNLLDQNLKYPQRRIIAAVSRFDKRKNIHGLIKAYALDARLRRIANLVVFAKTLEGSEEEQNIIKQINRTIRRHDLYENVALPAIQLDYERQMPAFYRFLAQHKGVFINPSLIEPFGLTIIEASACGVPVVATKNGGAAEIIKDNITGLLINPENPKDIGKKIREMLTDDEEWGDISKSATEYIRLNYSWPAKAKKFLELYKALLKKKASISHGSL